MYRIMFYLFVGSSDSEAQGVQNVQVVPGPISEMEPVGFFREYRTYSLTRML